VKLVANKFIYVYKLDGIGRILKINKSFTFLSCYYIYVNRIQSLPL